MYWNLIHSGGQIKVWGMDLSLKLFPISAHGSFLSRTPLLCLRGGRRGASVLPDGSDQQPQPQDWPGDAQPAAGHAAGLTAYFRILLHRDPSRRCVVYDYFYRYPHNYSRHHVPHGSVEPTKKGKAIEQGSRDRTRDPRHESDRRRRARSSSQPKKAPSRRPTQPAASEKASTAESIRPTPKPQGSQARSRAKRKRKAR